MAVSVFIPVPALATFALVVALATPGAQAPSQTTLIRNARVIDGSGGAARAADVRIEGDRITAVGQLTPAAGEQVIDAQGLALAPGFIDTHSHHERGLDKGRDALAMVSQGITTIVSGQDGGGMNLAALFARLEQHPASVNVASYAGHGEIRDHVMGDDFQRHATGAELDRMKALLQAEMAAGALGLSTGLEYDPGIYSARDEVLALAKVAGAAGGRYISHMRSEDRDFWEALDEIIQIGRANAMPVQISHMKLAMRGLWGQSAKLVAELDRARASGVQLTADIYPYTYWQSNLGVLYPKRNFDDAAETAFVLEHVAGAEDIIFSAFRGHPEYAGKTLADIAGMRGASHAKTLMDLLASPGGPDAGIVARGMADADVERLMQWPFANVCSDGTSSGLHPRGFGSFPKVLGPYVRDKKLFTLEEAVRKMTTLAAANVGIVDRGRIATGQFADLVLFDPATVADRADFGKAQAQAVGIHTVWVNGQVVFSDGQTTGMFSGRPLRRAVTAGR
ncbi:MAG: D-aminoacylase [Acidobacteriota bacterium]|nr:D-aminoacylase [Acidobacteriota bacterium]